MDFEALRKAMKTELRIIEDQNAPYKTPQRLIKFTEYE